MRLNMYVTYKGEKRLNVDLPLVFGIDSSGGFSSWIKICIDADAFSRRSARIGIVHSRRWRCNSSQDFIFAHIEIVQKCGRFWIIYVKNSTNYLISKSAWEMQFATINNGIQEIVNFEFDFNFGSNFRTFHKTIQFCKKKKKNLNEIKQM